MDFHWQDLKKQHQKHGKTVGNDKVVKNWMNGYYLTIHPVDENRSHASLFWENISSVNNIVIESIKQNHKEWIIIDYV